MTRESVDDPSQYHVRTLSATGEASERQLSDFPHPYPQLKGLQKKILRYKRSDGIDLTGMCCPEPA